LTAQVCLGPCSRSLARCVDPRTGFFRDGDRRTRRAGAAPPPRPTRTGTAQSLSPPDAEDGLRAQHDFSGAEANRNGALPASPR
jgi:hypothetical protein